MKRNTALLGIQTFLAAIYERKLRKSEVEYVVACFLGEPRDPKKDLERLLVSLNGRPFDSVSAKI